MPSAHTLGVDSLEQRDVVAYLLSRGVLPAGRVVNEAVRVVDTSRRNRIYRVETEAEPAFLVKSPRDADGVATIAMEAQLLGSIGSRESLRTPEVFDWNDKNSTLVVRLVRGADLRVHASQSRRFPRWIARATGSALRQLHSIDVRSPPWSTTSFPHAHAPWVLDLDAPDIGLETSLSGANLTLLRIVQSSGIADELASLREIWRDDALIHHDIRWDNWIAPDDERQLVLVDLELLAPGDAAWDIGCAFEGYLAAWVDSMPILPSVRPDQLVDLATRPLDRFKPLIRATWHGYSEKGQLEPSFLDRAVRWCAARLVQTAYERSQAAWDLSGQTLLLLQLALNLLRRPTEGRVQLLGLP